MLMGKIRKKKKKKLVNLSSSELAQRVVKVKTVFNVNTPEIFCHFLKGDNF